MANPAPGYFFLWWVVIVLDQFLEKKDDFECFPNVLIAFIEDWVFGGSFFFS